MSDDLRQRADSELANVRRHGAALRAQLDAANPLLWLGGGVVAGAVAARIAGSRKGVASKRPAPIALLAGLAEGFIVAKLEPLLARARQSAPESP
jgi:hypothetical protein